ncbi:hypothetical protein [Flavobacterium microcysteis]
MKKVLQSILVLSCICIAVFVVSCQDEENETRQNEETLSKTAPLTGLMKRVSVNATVDDNIIDSTSCFSVKLPVNLIVNSQAVTINTENDYHLVSDIFEMTDADQDYVDFVFPITIIYPDYSEVVVQNETQFNTLKEACQEPEPEQRNIGCISIHYPIRVFGYNSNYQLAHTYTIRNDMEFFLLLFNLNATEFYAVDYPIIITNADGNQVTIRNNIEMTGAIMAAIEDCTVVVPECNTSQTNFIQAYNHLKGLNNVREEFTMDTDIHEFSFSVNRAGTICSIGYQAEERSTPIVYLIELVDENNNIIYTGNHTFSDQEREYISIPPVTISPGHVYSLRRSTPLGAGVGTIIWDRGNISAPFLPYTNGNITLLHSKFYVNGGMDTPVYYMLPLIDFVFRPN